MEKQDHFLEHFFNPESVAIVGATNNTLKMNFRIMRNLIDLNFQGTIYPVNPGAQEISGIRAFARSTWWSPRFRPQRPWILLGTAPKFGPGVSSLLRAVFQKAALKAKSFTIIWPRLPGKRVFAFWAPTP